MKHILHKKAKHFVSILLGLVIMLCAGGCNKKPELANVPETTELIPYANEVLATIITHRGDIAVGYRDEALQDNSYTSERFDLCLLNEYGNLDSTLAYLPMICNDKVFALIQFSNMDNDELGSTCNTRMISEFREFHNNGETDFWFVSYGDRFYLVSKDGERIIPEVLVDERFSEVDPETRKHAEEVLPEYIKKLDPTVCKPATIETKYKLTPRES